MFSILTELLLMSRSSYHLLNRKIIFINTAHIYNENEPTKVSLV